MSTDSRSLGSFRRLLAQQASANNRLFFRLAFNILREAAAAEDVCQHAFMKAWERQNEINDGNALGAWLVAVIVNESLRLVRRRKIENLAMMKLRLSPRPPEMPPQQETDLRESIVAALAALPEPLRLVVSLRMQSGLSGNEVKEILGCSAAEVSRQLHSGLDMLRNKLAPWQDAELGVGDAM